MQFFIIIHVHKKGQVFSFTYKLYIIYAKKYWTKVTYLFCKIKNVIFSDRSETEMKIQFKLLHNCSYNWATIFSRSNLFKFTWTKIICKKINFFKTTFLQENFSFILQLQILRNLNFRAVPSARHLDVRFHCWQHGDSCCIDRLFYLSLSVVSPVTFDRWQLFITKNIMRPVSFAYGNCRPNGLTCIAKTTWPAVTCDLISAVTCDNNLWKHLFVYLLHEKHINRFSQVCFAFFFLFRFFSSSILRVRTELVFHVPYSSP